MGLVGAMISSMEMFSMHWPRLPRVAPALYGELTPRLLLRELLYDAWRTDSLDYLETSNLVRLVCGLPESDKDLVVTFSPRRVSKEQIGLVSTSRELKQFIQAPHVIQESIFDDDHGMARAVFWVPPITKDLAITVMRSEHSRVRFWAVANLYPLI